jgi:hypothetical protein
MLDQGPRLWVGVVLGLMAVGIYVAGSQVDALWQRMLALGCLVVVGGGAGFSLLDWAAVRWISHWRMVREAESMTPELRNLQVIERMRPEAIQLVLAMMPVVNVLPGANGPSFSLVVGGGSIPYEFIDKFLRMGDGDWLCPIRQFGEGSREREWAQLLTNWMVLMGYAEGPRGMRPARWMDRVGGMTAIGIHEEGKGMQMITEDFVGEYLKRRQEQRRLAAEAEEI